MRVEEGRVRVEREERVGLASLLLLLLSPLLLSPLPSPPLPSPPSSLPHSLPLPHSMCSVLNQSQDSSSDPKRNKKDQETSNEMVSLIPTFDLPSSLFAFPSPIIMVMYN